MSVLCSAGQLLGRCHAARGEHELSVSAFNEALKLAKMGRYLLSEYLTVRGQALAGQGAGGAGRHWSKQEGQRRLVEVAGRMCDVADLRVALGPAPAPVPDYL